MSVPFVPRPDVAHAIADMLTPDPLFGESAGMFLAAPRRTGKSTFLRRDLTPLLRERGLVVLYVDLWSDKGADPGDLIRACLQKALEDHAKPIARLRKKLPIDRLGALGFTLGFKEGTQAAMTSADALQLIVDATDSDVVLIIDEAQQALETKAGNDAMYALKAARDAVNQGDGPHHLYLVMTGSHRDKLAALVYDQKAPFFGARIRDFPRLGAEFTQVIADRINTRLKAKAQISHTAMEEAFEELGRRPELLNECLRDWLFSEEEGVQKWHEHVRKKREGMEAARRSEIEALTTLQRALLKLIAQDGMKFAPYSDETREGLKSANAGRRPASGSIQKALNELRELQFIWRPGYGHYALENADIKRILLDD